MSWVPLSTFEPGQLCVINDHVCAIVRHARKTTFVQIAVGELRGQVVQLERTKLARTATTFEEWQTQQHPPRPHCEFDHGEDTKRAATVYGGYGGANDWAGYACDEHAKMPGFVAWERLRLEWVHGEVAA